tara:strand:- start:605 stop:1330 length:726 start_codon:yes stop_codon:yes gene_type:complete
MEDEENWWSIDHLSEESELSEEQNPPNELLPESIGREKTDSIIEETTSVIEKTYTQQEYLAQSEKNEFLGFSWLTRGEAVTFIVIFILAFSFVVGGILLMPSAPTYEQNEAVILTSYADYDIYEASSCDSDNRCDYWTKIECWADIDLYHIVDSVNYTAQLNGWEVYDENYYRDAELDCISFVENETLSPGVEIQIFYNMENPEKAYQILPIHTGEILFITGILCFVSLPLVFLYIRFNSS